MDEEGDEPKNFINSVRSENFPLNKILNYRKKSDDSMNVLNNLVSFNQNKIKKTKTKREMRKSMTSSLL